MFLLALALALAVVATRLVADSSIIIFIRIGAEQDVLEKYCEILQLYIYISDLVE